MRFSGVFQSASFTVRKRSVNAFLPPPYTVAKLSKNAPKTAKKIRNACGKNPHPLPPSCGSQSPKNRFVRPFFGILQVLAPKTPARWPFSHSLCVFTALEAGSENPFTLPGTAAGWRFAKAKKQRGTAMKFQDIVRQKRKELGLTQEQAARRLGVSPAAVSKWESGVSQS